MSKNDRKTPFTSNLSQLIEKFTQNDVIAEMEKRDFSFGYGNLGIDLSHIGEFQHGLTRKHVGSHIHILGSDDA